MQVNILEKNGVIEIQGAVVFETVATIRKSVAHLQQQCSSASECRIDLTMVDRVNSAALGLCIEFKKQAARKKQTMIFVNPPKRLLALAQVYGVSNWLGF